MTQSSGPRVVVVVVVAAAAAVGKRSLTATMDRLAPRPTTWHK